MNDPIKQFVGEHREAFDSEEPGSQVLKKIQDTVPGYSSKKKQGWWTLRQAAILTGVLLVSASLFFFGGKNNKTPGGSEPSERTEEIITLDIGDPVYAKQIYHFRELIGLKQTELKQLEKEYPQLYREFVGDIVQLDSSYQALKLKLAENPNREMLLEAMIQNLQLQSELLNRQLTIIKEIKQKSKSYEKTI